VKLQSYQENVRKLQEWKRLALPAVAEAGTRQLSGLLYEEVAYGPLQGVLVKKNH